MRFKFSPGLLAIFAVGLFFAALTAAAQSDKKAPVPPDHLTLLSPNGKYTIILQAMNSGAGIWIQQAGSNGMSKPFVSISNFDNLGSSIAVNGTHPDGKFKGYDAAIWAKDKVGMIQLTDENGVVSEFDSKRLNKIPPNPQ